VSSREGRKVEKGMSLDGWRKQAAWERDLCKHFRVGNWIDSWIWSWQMNGADEKI